MAAQTTYRIGLLERHHPPGHQGAVMDQVIPLLQDAGMRVDLVHAEEGAHRLDLRPSWDVVVLKSGSAAALHVAAAAEAWGIPCLNASAATRLAQDKLASTAVLQRAGLPIAAGHLAWLPVAPEGTGITEVLEQLSANKVLVKAARGSQGAGLWMAQPGELLALASSLPPGPYLLMEHVPHSGDDLKVFVAGAWMAGIERPFPARTLAEKRGRSAHVPSDVARWTYAAGRSLGLQCYGCDWVRSPDGWRLVDVNAFPGYKGPDGAAAALVAEILRAARGGAA